MLCAILRIILLAWLSGMLLTSLTQQSLSPLCLLGHFCALLVRFWSFWALCPMQVGCLMCCRHFRDDVTAWAGLVHFCGGVLAPVLVQGCQGVSPGSQMCRHLSMVTPFVCFSWGPWVSVFSCSAWAYHVSMQSIKRYKGHY